MPMGKAMHFWRANTIGCIACARFKQLHSDSFPDQGNFCILLGQCLMICSIIGAIICINVSLPACVDIWLLFSKLNNVLIL